MKYKFLIFILTFSKTASATGIMPPDFGPVGNFLVYLGNPFVIFLVIVLLLFFLVKLIFSYLKKKDIKVIKATKNKLKKNPVYSKSIFYFTPYILILIYALIEIRDLNSPLKMMILVEVFGVYLIVFFIPVMIYKFLKRTRNQCQESKKSD